MIHCCATLCGLWRMQILNGGHGLDTYLERGPLESVVSLRSQKFIIQLDWLFSIAALRAGLCLHKFHVVIFSLLLDNNCNFFNVYQLNYQCGHSMLCTAMTVELCFLFSLKMEQAVPMQYATTALSVLGDCQM